MERRSSTRLFGPVGSFTPGSLLAMVLVIFLPVLGYSAEKLIVQDTGVTTIVSSGAGNLIQMSTTSSSGGAGFSFAVPTGGDWYFKATQDNGFKIRDAKNSKDVIYFQYATGNVGIGTDAPAHTLHLGGGAYSDGVSWINGSSREYKENIKDLQTEDAMEALKRLNPVAFNYKASLGENRLGFIAEDVPELVATKDRKGLSPMDIVAVLTKVVQEQQSLIKKLEQRLLALEGKGE